MSETTFSGPHYTRELQPFFRVIDKLGAEVAVVYAVSHAATATTEQAVKQANRRALAIAKLVDDDIEENGEV